MSFTMKFWEIMVAFNLCVSVVAADQCTANEVATMNHRMARIIVLDFVNTGHVKVIKECVQACLLFSACKAFAFRWKNSECELYRANKTTNPFDVVNDSESEEWTYSDISEWPKSIAGSCQYLTCGEDEVCLPITKGKYVKFEADCAGNGWVGTSNYCYKIIPHDNVTRATAVEGCKQEDAILTDIQSAEEHAALTGLLESQIPKIWRNNQITHEYNGVMIGGTDRDVEGTWIWESRGNVPFEISIWYPSEPNNKNNDQDCAFLGIYLPRGLGKMFDFTCGTDTVSELVRGYICKKQPRLHI